jgi:threonylcarbamoyladenosine tRNA methylthiotransferase MtaB
MAFARVHTFSYSPRQGTPAIRLSAQVSRDERRKRARVMRLVGKELAGRFRQRFLGREMIVLWERRRRDGLWSGLTDNYVRVVTQSESDLHNRTLVTHLLKERGDCLWGQVIR